MVALTRLNGKKFVLNSELIKTIESNPDTTITLVNGDHMIVAETMDEVIDQVVIFGRHLRKLTPPS